MTNSLLDIRIRQREFLLAISRALTAELELSDVLRIILQAAVEFIAGRAGMIVLADPNEKIFRVAAALGIPGDNFERYPQLLRGIPFEEGAEQDALPKIDKGIQALASELSADLDVAQTILLPMQNGETIIGMIYVFQEKNYIFSSDAPNLLQSFADQAAIAVKNARLYEQIISEKKRLDAILEQSADGVLILDPQLHIQVFNQALSNICGWKAAEVIGCHHDTVLQWHNLRSETDLLQALEQGWPMPGSPSLYVEGEIIKANGENVHLGVTYAPLLSSRGRMINIIANVRDLTRYRQEEQLQKTFISVVSHELKTPVSIIKGYAGTLRRRDVDWPHEVIDEYLSVIEEEADQLTDLIDNLLEVSRLQAGNFKLNLTENISIPSVARNTAKKFQTQTTKHDFEIDFSADYPEINVDERRITQVFNNLISNAIKYSPSGGLIRLSGTMNDGYVTVSVSDEGIGIPDHERHRIFQQFSRLDNDLSRKTEGTGLGLFLSKAIVEAHNGRIWFTSQVDPAEGAVGTTFTFSLPKQK